MGISSGIILLIIAISFQFDTPEPEPAPESTTDLKTTPEPKQEKLTVKAEADVIMPTKVSRPGCEETDSCYVPSEISIKKGDEIVWLNADVAFHSVTSGVYGEPTDLFDSGHLDPNEKFSFTFNESGVFDYFCTLHPWMDGQVIVE